MDKKWYLNRNLLCLWIGLMISYLGDALFLVAFMWIAVTRGSVGAPAIIIALQTLPMVLFGPFVGVMVDRLPKRRLMIGSDLIRAIILFLVLIADLNGLLAIWHLYILAFVLGMFELIYRPLVRILIPTLVSADFLASANSLLLGTQQLTSIFGAIAGGVIVGAIGPQVVLALDAATFLFVAGMIFFVEFAPSLRQSQSGRVKGVSGILMDVLGGIRYVTSRRDILTLLLTITGLNLAVSPVNALLPAYATEVLEGGSFLLGMLYGAEGLGMLLGNILISMLASRISLSISIGIGLGVMAIGVMGLASSQIPFLSFGFYFLAGLGVPLVFTTTFTHLQKTVPLEYQGRVFALQQSTATLAVPIASFLTAAMINILSIRYLLVIASLALLVVAALAVPNVRAGKLT